MRTESMKGHVSSQSILLAVLLFGAVASDFGEILASEPTFELTDLNGEVHRLEEYQGRIVVLNFWATWCGPCVAEMPMFVRTQKRFESQGVVVLAASLDSEDTAEGVPAFVKKFKMGFPVLMGASLEHLASFDLGEALPATVFIDPEGNVAFRIIGQAHRKEVFKRIEWMLGKGEGKPPKALLDNL